MLLEWIRFWFYGVDSEGTCTQGLERAVCFPYAARAVLVSALLGDEEGVGLVAVDGADAGVGGEVDVWGDEVEGWGETEPGVR